MITNTNKQGYGVGLYPNAKTDDGILNMIIINKTNIFYLNYLIVLVLLGLSIEKKKNVQYIELKDLKIISKNYYINFQIDGEFEFISKNVLDISVIPGGIDILC